MKVIIIVAATRDLAIGHEGDLLYHISADLKRFKCLTTGHPIIMGRKTFESFPNGPLPGRHNIVLSRREDYHPDGVTVVRSLREALDVCKEEDKVFIIGGGEIYRQALPVADEIYLTLIDVERPDADTRFPEIKLPEVEFTEHDPRSGLDYAFPIIPLK